MQWRMARGGRAWRGYFPAGGELTSGRPDWKEGLYFGAELPDDHPLVRARTPIHGRNLFPDLPGFREDVLAYLEALTRLGHALMEGLALSLGLEASYFAASLHGRSAHPLPHLQLPVPPRSGREGRALGRGRAHRLRPAHHPVAGRRRRPRGEDPRGLDRGAAGARVVRLQHRRHARPHDGRPLPLDPASRRPQHLRARPPVAPLLLRSPLRGAGASPSPAWSPRPTTARRAGTRRTSTPSRAPTATICSARSPRSSRSCAARFSEAGPRSASRGAVASGQRNLQPRKVARALRQGMGEARGYHERVAGLTAGRLPSDSRRAEPRARR